MEPVSRQPIEALPELVGPDYNLYRYRADFYKVVRFKSTAPRLGAVRKPKEEGFKHEDKLPAALSRARRVCLELALCNDWKWFATFTIAESTGRFAFVGRCVETALHNMQINAQSVAEFLQEL